MGNLYKRFSVVIIISDDVVLFNKNNPIIIYTHSKFSCYNNFFKNKFGSMKTIDLSLHSKIKIRMRRTFFNNSHESIGAKYPVYSLCRSHLFS